MNKITAAISGVAGFVPDDVLTNKELETMVDTTDEWIYTRTGIKERRILKGEGKATSDMAVEAARQLLEKTGTHVEDLELLICATVTGDMVFPDTANTICYKIGAKNAFGFDINAACSGFIYALTIGAKFIETGSMQKVMVIGADKMSSIVDYEDRATCVLFGDGAGAVLLEPSSNGSGILDSALHGDGEGRTYLHMKAGGSLKPATAETVRNREHFVYQEGRQVFKSAIQGMLSSINEILRRNDLEIGDIDWIVPHQANKRIITSVADLLGVPLEKVMLNIDKYGNTTAATIPLCLWEWEEQLRKGHKLILTAFGGGFTWGSVLVEWLYDGRSAD